MACSDPTLFRGLAALLLASAVAWAARRRGWLSPDGAWAAWALGVWLFGLAGWRWAVPLLVFFGTSSWLTRWKGHAPRDAGQVLANGGIPGLLAGLCWLYPSPKVWWAYIAALAFATGDTWASELGRRWAARPISLRTGRPTQAGASGAVSLPGTLAAVAGAGLMAAVGWALFGGPVLEAFRAAGFGFLAVVVDSLLGAWVQGQARCPQCGQVVEAGEPHPCPGPLQPLSGWPWMTNNMVNLTAQALAALLALF